MAALRSLGPRATRSVPSFGGNVFHLCQFSRSLPSIPHRLFHSKRCSIASWMCARSCFRSLGTWSVPHEAAKSTANATTAKGRWGMYYTKPMVLTVFNPSMGMASTTNPTTTTTTTTTTSSTSSSSPGPGEFSIKTMKYTFVVLSVLFSGVTGYLFAQWGAPQVDEEGNEIEDEYTHLPLWKGYALRFWRELHYYDKMIKEPSRDKLLPDPLTEPYYQPPYTVVLEMTGVLVHPDWTYKTGWRFKKRPGVDYFLQQISPPLYETVIYTSEQGFTAFPILDTLDPQGRIMYRLFRDATRYVKGHHVKDLSCLNRDLSKVIFIDWNENSFEMQPENALKLKKWSGNDDDRTLVDLAAFLRTVATSQVDDVRSVLAFYKQFDDPIEAFRMNQKRLEEEQQKSATLHGVDKSDRRSSWTSVIFKRWQ